MKHEKVPVKAFFRGISILSVLLFSSLSFAATIHVPDDQPTIQAGIDAAVEGDTVLVADGTYKGDGNKNIDFKGKAITVQSENAAETCIIDCEGEGRGFYFYSAENQNSVLTGFTITNGNIYHGGGIYLTYGSSPTITKCIITSNTATSNGGGINCWKSANPHISNCVISNNVVTGGYNEGGGIRIYDSSPKITDCTISGNSVTGDGGGISIEYYSSPTITNCSITNNVSESIYNSYGGGVLCRSNSTPSFTACIISNNRAKEHGGGAFCTSDTTFNNCTISNNTTDRYRWRRPVFF
ncbi:MAG: right-handed parallel beta-helix repeat-containing protein [Deltaproteobacteria bacterium]|nr:right-handed parallel beta-helix repeat-containing protein [Deltaproteobacteria bacterium]